ncbi:MAG: hypothetical protein R2819_09070 [Allomuricauda sp.]
MKNIIVAYFVLFTAFAAAQENLVYGELGGAGPILSINYERQFFEGSHLNLRAGLGLYAGWYTGLSIPTGLYYLEDLNKGNYLELGMTYTVLLTGWEDDEAIGFLLPAIGYRKYYQGKKSFLKITFSPIIFNDDPFELVPWGGISVGKRF